MKRKNILITGSEGFIGVHLLESLFRTKNVAYKIDICDLVLGTDIFDDEFEDKVKRADIVIHLAALTSVEQSFKNPGDVFRTNVLGTARVVELCIKYKKKLIFPSSAAVYHRELSPYAESKGLAEDIVKGAMSSIPVVILRLYNVYGEGMNPNTGSIMYNFLTADELTVYGDGEQTRDFINVKDVVNIIKDAFKSKWNGKIVDIGSGHAYTINEIAGTFAYYRDLEVTSMPPRREIKWSIANTQMLHTLYKKKLITNIPRDIENLCLHQ